MKTRSGYVSNSSSSSFVVVLRDDRGKETPVTAEMESVLRGYGFRYVREYWKTALTEGSELFDDRSGFKPSDPVAMYYDVACNEDEVEDFLIENRIPFAEWGHYGDFLRQYDGVSDYYDTYANAGENFLRYGFGDKVSDDLQRKIIARVRPFYRIRISDDADITDEYLNAKDI